MYLGLDIGTSSVKAVLIDDKQKIIASETASLTVSRPRPGWSEQDPKNWWAATNTTIRALRRKNAKAVAAVSGIGLSGQMHGATLLDRNDKVLRPAILWNDGRSMAECAEIEARCPRLRDIAGNIAMPGFTAPKLLWVKKHEPKTFAKTAKVLLPKDYVRLCLSGDYVSDMSDSAGTLWMDVARRAWSDEILAATDLDRSHMPRLIEGSEASGELRTELAQEWGMKTRPVIAGGGGDNAASACGIGAVTSGSAFVSLGTSGVLFVSNARFSPNTEGAVHAFCHAVPSTWHQMGVILSAAASLDWLAKTLKTPAPKLVGSLGQKLADPSPVLFTPYLSGERTPHNDAAVRGAFLGLGHETDTAVLTHAVLDGVAFAFRDCLEALKMAGTEVSRATAVGGGSRSELWLKIIATVLGIPIDIPAEGDFGAAYGAARLGLIAAKGVAPSSILKPPKTSRTIKPERKAAAAYAEAYARYRRAYPALKEVFR
jgi:xylulokinase